MPLLSFAWDCSPPRNLLRAFARAPVAVVFGHSVGSYAVVQSTEDLLQIRLLDGDVTNFA